MPPFPVAFSVFGAVPSLQHSPWLATANSVTQQVALPTRSSARFYTWEESPAPSMKLQLLRAIPSFPPDSGDAEMGSVLLPSLRGLPAPCTFHASCFFGPPAYLMWPLQSSSPHFQPRESALCQHNATQQSVSMFDLF